MSVVIVLDTYLATSAPYLCMSSTHHLASKGNTIGSQKPIGETTNLEHRILCQITLYDTEY